MSTTVKLQSCVTQDFHVRKIKVNNFGELKTLVIQWYATNHENNSNDNIIKPESLIFDYVDEDGDEVRLDSETEWKQLCDAAKQDPTNTGNLVRIRVRRAGVDFGIPLPLPIAGSTTATFANFDRFSGDSLSQEVSGNHNHGHLQQQHQNNNVNNNNQASPNFFHQNNTVSSSSVSSTIPSPSSNNNENTNNKKTATTASSCQDDCLKETATVSAAPPRPIETEQEKQQNNHKKEVEEDKKDDDVVIVEEAEAEEEEKPIQEKVETKKMEPTIVPTKHVVVTAEEQKPQEPIVAVVVGPSPPPTTIITPTTTSTGKNNNSNDDDTNNTTTITTKPNPTAPIVTTTTAPATGCRHLSPSLRYAYREALPLLSNLYKVNAEEAILKMMGGAFRGAIRIQANLASGEIKFEINDAILHEHVAVRVQELLSMNERQLACLIAGDFVRLYPSSSSGHYNYAVALAKADQLDTALAELQYAVNFGVDPAQARNDVDFAPLRKFIVFRTLGTDEKSEEMKKALPLMEMFPDMTLDNALKLSKKHRNNLEAAANEYLGM